MLGKAPPEPLSLVVSSADTKANVIHNGVLIGRAKNKIKDPEQGLDEAVFARIEAVAKRKAILWPDKQPTDGCP